MDVKSQNITLSNDQQVIQDGRKNVPDVPEASLRDQIPKKLNKRLKDMGIAETVRHLWHSGNANRADWLEKQRNLLYEFEEFIQPIYDAPYNWSSTMHMPISYMLCRSFHSRMQSALLAVDPPFSVIARKEANSDRQFVVQDLMRYAVKDWANEHAGIEEAIDSWVWQWVTSGRGILKYRWDTKYTKYMDVVEVPKPGGLQYSIDEQGNEVAVPVTKMVEEEQEVTIKCFDGPVVEVLQLEDLLIVGGDGDPDRADAVLHIQYLTASELWQLADRGIFDADEVEAVIQAGPDLKSSDITGIMKQERAEINGQGSLDVQHDLDRYRVVEAYLKKDVDGSGINSDVVCWVATNSGSLLRSTYLHRISKLGKRPFAVIDFHRRTDTTQPVGLVELTYSLCKELDAMHNMRVDFGLLSTLPFGFYRASSSLAQEKIPFEPGAMIPLDNPQADVFFPNLGNRTSFGMQEEAALYNMIERMTSMSDLSLGVLGAQGAARTASGARIVAGESNNNLDVYLRRMNRGFKKLLHGLFEMVQTKVEPGFEYRLLGDDGQQYWKQVRSREEIAGTFDFEVDGASANSNKMVQLDTAQQIYQLTANPLDIQLGIITPSERFEAIKNLMQVMGVRNWSRYAKKPSNATRLFTPEEIANRILAGIDVRLGPEQDLESFIAYCDYIFETDELLGQFNQDQAIALKRKQMEAQQMAQALKEMAAQQANAQQMQNNAAMSQQQTNVGAAAPAAQAPVGAPQG